MGAMDEEDFDYFMDWLISRGQDVFERALEDPQSLADAVYAAYRNTHDDDLPVSWTGPDREAGPAGEPWDPADLPRLFPRLRTVED
jgi:uncharacterized protein DUF4240